MTYQHHWQAVQAALSQQSVDTTYDVIVLGVGSMGAATCYHLAKRGLRVLGLEQFDIPHNFGSHAGQSRIIRKAYGEGSAYVPLLERAYQNWQALESETGTQVYYPTGLVYFGETEDQFLSSVRDSAKRYAIPLNTLSVEESRAKYPQFHLPEHFARLEEPEAGFLLPELSILLFVRRTLALGGTILTNTQVLDWTRGSSGPITVTTNRGVFKARKLIITAGPWASKVIPALAPKLQVTRQVVAWVEAKDQAGSFSLEHFPCWIIKDKDWFFYGFPTLSSSFGLGPIGLKLGLHYPEGQLTDPDKVDPLIAKSDEECLISFMRRFIPDGYHRTLELKTCLYTNTRDQDFIIDYLPDSDKDIVYAAGFSGHGFKFASVIGEVLTDMAEGASTSLPIDFLSAKRFE
jgi:sarcosine oxidase